MRRGIIGKRKGVYGSGLGFIMQIQTTTANQTFTLPTRTGYSYNATVYWGDGTSSSVTAHNVNNAKTYATAGTYDIEITGQFDTIYFNGGGSCSLVKKILNWGLDDFQGFTTMASSFYGCNYLNELAEGIIKQRTAITTFASAFRSCSSLVSIPSGLLDNNTSVTSFSNCFNGCNALRSLPTDLFRYNTSVTSFIFCFSSCRALTSLPADLFRYNTSVTGTAFASCFDDCRALTSLPADLFRYNTSVTSFALCFQNCTSLTSLPADLFRYNTSVTSFLNCFNGCSALTSLPADLFRYNTSVTSFDGCFNGCVKLQLRTDMFDTANFLNKSINWSSFVRRTSFSGTQGTMQDIWNADYGTGTPNLGTSTTRPFGDAGNSTTSISNYDDIPTGWKA